LKQHFNQVDLDIRKQTSGYSRFLDQKVTPDVLSFIADCIVNFLGGKDAGTTFVVGNIWEFPYFIKNTVAVFGNNYWKNDLLFRGYLRKNSVRAKQYAELKTELAEKHADDRGTYTKNKEQFINETLEMAKQELK
ncbi:MAG: hypothetical protein COW61_02595, partial [Candidatus Yonathbacteria bacterium CG17_big_fil_post_rev_8_21_14_2_50_46_19]